MPTDRDPGHRLLRCATGAELDLARGFRNQVFLHRRSIVFADESERRRDEQGHVFLLLEDGAPVATARALPYPSEASALSAAAPPGLGWHADSEVSRVAAARSRQYGRYALLVLTLGSAWLLEATDHRRYVAHCHPALLKTYRLIGAEDTGRSYVVPGRGETHRVILGRHEEVVRRGLDLLGLGEAQARALVRWRVPVADGLRSA